MAILWINLIVVYISSLFARYFSYPKAQGIPFVKPNKLFLFFSLACLVLISGLRNNIGDTFMYMHSYANKDFSLQNIEFKGDFGFNIFQGILQSISKDPQFLIFTTALISNLLIVLVLIKFSRMIELSLYVYITSGMFTVSMNGIRQFLAATIIFCATKYLLNGEFKKYLIIILVTSTIHTSALVLLPIYFIVRREAWTKITFILLALAVLIVMGFNQFSEILFSALEDTQYGHYSSFSEGGANIIRVMVDSVPVIIAYLGRDKLRQLWPKSDYIVNLSIISLTFMLIATQNWIFARFNIYFSLYNLILISWIVYLFKESNRKFIYYSLLVCYFIYFFYEQVISLGIYYKSDYLIFVN
ncbi:EpsG family protein [Bacillus canaveralius]|uniref:EpsG family protein n=1 Tax=Bacillus canaveralius TaxID=1403243 RepID=A0A2N5GFV9_9BACI|nr:MULTISPECIES: EpsG family protein [Bacillus]PLR79636.1 EpsG family protein [Bacillus canaveralius]PLR87252.1 EpsG family protein [Bacillus sp. V33-4]PLR92067.1 EpsG family protein [Bacillus canaveralius]RSK53481.1 EpsG family protein [Bacillus canaveralius]